MSTSGPTPEWFGKPSVPPPNRSSAAVVVAVVATFAVTVVLCGIAGFGLYGMAQRERAEQAANCAAELAAAEQMAAKRQADTEKECAARVAREAARCAESRVPVQPPEDVVEDGESPAKAFASVLREARGKFRNCFQETLRTSPSAQGRATLVLSVSADGEVKRAHVKSSTLPASMHACLKREALRLRFPETGKDQTVQVPVSFVSQ